MRSTLLAVFAFSIALVAPSSAGAIASSAPTVNPTGFGTTSDSVTRFFSINANGSATDYSLTYLQHVGCDGLTQEEIDGALTTELESIPAAFGDLSRSITAGELSPETGYCVRVSATNTQGTTTTPWGYIETQGLPVNVADLELTKNAFSIGASFTVTPGTYYSDTVVALDYFAKGESDCTAGFELSTLAVPFDGIRGFTPEPLSAKIDSLEHSTAYCVRVRAATEYSSTMTDWEVVTTSTPATATISEVHFSPASEGPSGLSVLADDKGAAADMDKSSSLSAKVVEATGGECDASAFVEATTLDSSKVDFAGSDDIVLGIDGLEVGTSYCAVIMLDSAWGPDWSTSQFFAFDAYAAPIVSALSGTGAWDSISVAAEFNARNNPTSWTIRYYVKGDEACVAGGVKSHMGGEGSVTGEDGLMSDHQIELTISDLEPNTSYCLIMYLFNDAAEASFSTGVEVTTRDAVAPEVPTGLSATGISATGATLNWSTSSDDHGIVGYKVFRGKEQIGTTDGTSMAVTLTCGETSHFRVVAVDDAGNESDSSAILPVTGSACPSEEPGATCLVAFAKKTLTLKPKKKKKVKASIAGSLSNDGQSVQITVTGKGVKAKFSIGGKSLTGSGNKVSVTTAGKVIVVISIKGASTKTSVTIGTGSCS